MVGRIAYTFTLTLALVMLVGWLRPPSDIAGVPPDAFFVRKLEWKPNYDIVLAGCSRVYMGLSPAVMKRTLPDYRIVNFGFKAVGYSANYLNAAMTLLDPQSPKKAIILGVAPHNFSLSNCTSNGYISTSNIRAFNKWILGRLGGSAYFLRPYDTWEIRCRLRGMRRYECYYEDGWVAGRTVPEDQNEWLLPIAAQWDRDKVDPPTTALLLDRVKQWTNAGIRVFGIRVPTTRRMRRVENEKSGFDQAAFVARFRAAGGIWISISLDGYHSYDGSHVRADSARKLSTVVAKIISNADHASRDRLTGQLGASQ